MVPSTPNVIRQDILADMLFFKYGLSHLEFIIAKRLSVSCNKNICNPNSREENDKWPALPEVFLKCPVVDANAVSMDEMADFFRYEKFEDQIQEMESDSQGGESVQVQCDPSANPHIDAHIKLDGLSNNNVDATRCPFCGSFVSPLTAGSRWKLVAIATPSVDRSCAP